MRPEDAAKVVAVARDVARNESVRACVVFDGAEPDVGEVPLQPAADFMERIVAPASSDPLEPLREMTGRIDP